MTSSAVSQDGDHQVKVFRLGAELVAGVGQQGRDQSRRISLYITFCVSHALSSGCLLEEEFWCRNLGRGRT